MVFIEIRYVKDALQKSYVSWENNASPSARISRSYFADNY